MSIYTIDFETKRIVSGSNKAPTPVGVSVKRDCGSSLYYSWGHPIQNNHTKDEAHDILNHVLDEASIIIMHNTKFDMRIMLEHFRLFANPSKIKLVDTMIMAYLHNPREDSLKLKDLVLKYCNYPALNQAILNKWIVEHVKCAPSQAGEYISEAPGSLVAKYAQDDTDMTYALYEFYKPILDRDDL